MITFKKILLAPANFRLVKNWKNKWQKHGRFNRLLISIALVSVMAFSVSGFFFVQQVQDTRDLKCLAMNVYHEARSEPKTGQYAVATVTMNRVRSKRYPGDVCEVVYQKSWSKKHQRYISAFSWTTDGKENIPYESSAWKNAFQVAEEVYNNNSQENKSWNKVAGALFYHADYVKPRWAAKKVRITKIGRHIFYR